MNDESQAPQPAAAPKPYLIDPARFGPWALVTGASSGIGREFAYQLAAHGINVVLAARRLPELKSIGRQIAQQYGVAYRAIEVDFAKGEPLANLENATRDIDIGLVISNAGDAILGEFLTAKREEMHALARVNVLAHLDLAHHFGPCTPVKPADRRPGPIAPTDGCPGSAVRCAQPDGEDVRSRAQAKAPVVG